MLVTCYPQKEGLERGRAMFVVVDDKRGQPKLPHGTTFVARIHQSDVTIHVFKNGRADGALSYYRGINTGNITNGNIGNILIDLGGVASGGQVSANSGGRRSGGNANF